VPILFRAPLLLLIVDPSLPGRRVTESMWLPRNCEKGHLHKC
jgi:hypothetical protein